MPSKQQLWGGETAKAVENFRISGETVPVPVMRWLARLKGAAAAVNGELGLLGQAERLPHREGRRGDRRGQARRAVPDRRLPDRLGHLDEHERQRGHRPAWPARACTPTTTSTWGSPPTTCSPRPSISPRSTSPRTSCCPRSSSSSVPSRRRRKASDSVVKAGRTHLMDAVPVTLGQEFAGYAAQMALGSERVQAALVHVGQIPLGGTATGTGLNTHPRFAEKVRARLRKESGPQADRRSARLLRGAGQPRRARRALRGAEGDRRVAHEDRGRPGPDGLRPPRRDRRDRPAGAAEGLLDHARQGQPGDPRGRAAGLRPGDRQRHRDHRRRACRASSS